MSRPKPLPPDILRTLIQKADLLLKNGLVSKDFVINTEEAAVISGLSPETVRQYGKTGHFPVIAYPGKNLYPLRWLCQWVLDHYRDAILPDTTQINGYKPTGRKRRKRNNFGITAKENLNA